MRYTLGYFDLRLIAHPFIEWRLTALSCTAAPVDTTGTACGKN